MRAQERCFVSETDPPSKQGILRAALALFVRHGLARTNVRMIGKTAGYTNPALFKFFASKDALALYLFERCYTRLYSTVKRAASQGPFDEALGSVLDAFLAAMDEDLEAVLFVQDTLRELWPRVPAPLRKRSILALLRALFRRGRRERAVDSFVSLDIPVAALVGLVAQFGRMTYFGEIQGPARRWKPELERLVLRMVRPDKD
jgi:AcrR family transcriptional regulator